MKGRERESQLEQKELVEREKENERDESTTVAVTPSRQSGIVTSGITLGIWERERRRCKKKGTKRGNG